MSRDRNAGCAYTKVATASRTHANRGSSTLVEPPYADPHVRWCGGCRQQWRRLPDLPEFVIHDSAKAYSISSSLNHPRCSVAIEIMLLSSARVLIVNVIECEAICRSAVKGATSVAAIMSNGCAFGLGLRGISTRINPSLPRTNRSNGEHRPRVIRITGRDEPSMNLVNSSGSICDVSWKSPF